MDAWSTKAAELRRNGKEMLGYIKGSLEELIEKLSERLRKQLHD